MSKNTHRFLGRPKKSLIARIVTKPTSWKGASVENLGPCDPLDLRYIKDQSYLEARIEASKRSILDQAWMFVWGVTSGYGTNILLWAGWSLFFAFTFGIIFWIGGDSLVSVGQISNADLLIQLKQWHLLSATEKESLVLTVLGGRKADFFTYLYFSVVTFTTLGFGDITPTSTCGEVIVMLEVVLGYLMLGGLISIFSHKLSRLA